LTALSESGADAAALAEALEDLCVQFEGGTVFMRNMREKNRVSDHASPCDAARETPALRIAGSAEVNGYGWVHIKMNALLPNCRFGAPLYISDTVARLLDEYERCGRALPRFETAMLAVDEHCDINARTVYDQDNKAWKAISNALKGRLIPDDDQFTLDVALLSQKSETPACHIYLLPKDEAADFFWQRQSLGY
jgi:hypothetical protein